MCGSGGTLAIAEELPGGDGHLGLAACLAADRRFDRAAAVLREGAVREPDNPVLIANQGIVLSDGGRPSEAIPFLQHALTFDPDFHQARFNLANAFARAGRQQRRRASRGGAPATLCRPMPRSAG